MGEKNIGRHNLDGRKVEVNRGDNSLVFLEVALPGNAEDLVDADVKDDIEQIDLLPRQARELGRDLIEASGGPVLADLLRASRNIIDAPGIDSAWARQMIGQVFLDVMCQKGTDGEYHDNQCILHIELRKALGLP